MKWQWRIFVVTVLTLTTFVIWQFAAAIMPPLRTHVSSPAVYDLMAAVASLMGGLYVGLRYAAPVPEWFRKDRGGLPRRRSE